MRVNNDVLAVLSNARTDGNSLILTGQLDRNLYTATNKVLEAAGGKWNRKMKAHVFPSDAAEAIEQIILTGEITVPQDFGYFPTPPDVAARVWELAQLESGLLVLEPSAGQGALIEGLTQCIVDAVELLPKNAHVLRGMCIREVFECDFLTMTPAPIYDRVVMNPPFEKQADIKHVLHAYEFLKPGGLLVSVMAAGVLFRENSLTVNFRNKVEECGGEIEELPDGAFKQSGTMVRTVIVTMPK